MCVVPVCATLPARGRAGADSGQLLGVTAAESSCPVLLMSSTGGKGHPAPDTDCGNGSPLTCRRLAGVKAFSSCSIRDFQRFLATGGGQCLLNRPAMDTAYKAPVCGNKVVEPGEACDCGTTKVSCGALAQQERAKPCVPGWEEQSQESFELLLYPPDLCAVQREPKAL